MWTPDQLNGAAKRCEHGARELIRPVNHSLAPEPILGIYGEPADEYFRKRGFLGSLDRPTAHRALIACARSLRRRATSLHKLTSEQYPQSTDTPAPHALDDSGGVGDGCTA